MELSVYAIVNLHTKETDYLNTYTRFSVVDSGLVGQVLEAVVFVPPPAGRSDVGRVLARRHTVLDVGEQAALANAFPPR